MADVVETDRDDDANVSTMGIRPDQFVDWSDGEDMALLVGCREEGMI